MLLSRTCIALVHSLTSLSFGCNVTFSGKPSLTTAFKFKALSLTPPLMLCLFVHFL